MIRQRPNLQFKMAVFDMRWRKGRGSCVLCRPRTLVGEGAVPVPHTWPLLKRYCGTSKVVRLSVYVDVLKILKLLIFLANFMDTQMRLLQMSRPIENQATAMFSSSIMLLSHGEQLRLLLSRLMLPRVKSLLFPQLLRKLSISENYALNSASLNRHHQFCEAAVALSKDKSFSESI